MSLFTGRIAFKFIGGISRGGGISISRGAGGGEAVIDPDSRIRQAADQVFRLAELVPTRGEVAMQVDVTATRLYDVYSKKTGVAYWQDIEVQIRPGPGYVDKITGEPSDSLLVARPFLDDKTGFKEADRDNWARSVCVFECRLEGLSLGDTENETVEVLGRISGIYASILAKRLENDD